MARTASWIVLAAAAALACSDRGSPAAQRGQAGDAQKGPQEQQASAEMRREEKSADPQKEAEARQQAAAKFVDGLLVRASHDEVVVRGQGGSGPEVRLKVDAGTQVMIGEQQGSVQDLKEGQQVRASYDASAGEPKATRIEARQGGAKP